MDGGQTTLDGGQTTVDAVPKPAARSPRQRAATSSSSNGVRSGAGSGGATTLPTCQLTSAIARSLGAPISSSNPKPSRTPTCHDGRGRDTRPMRASTGDGPRGAVDVVAERAVELRRDHHLIAAAPQRAQRRQRHDHAHRRVELVADRAVRDNDRVVAAEPRTGRAGDHDAARELEPADQGAARTSSAPAPAKLFASPVGAVSSPRTKMP